ncbi:restriction endonuclease subunit S [Enterobacter sp. CPE_E423]|uniref:restriction endonuclease subunit S n=1 Tax=unclassified Enterobacter TaxID=2608935 RepID=UPI003975BB9D
MSLGYISGTLPSEWETPFLVDLVSPKQWKTISTKELTDDGYVVYGANGKIGFYNKYTHESATLMITCRGATCGNLHISEPLSYINGNAMALDNQPTNYVNIKYLKYSLQARGLQDTISGSAQPQITKQGLEKVQIPLPAVNEQKIIAEKIDTLLAQVDSTKARLEQIPQILKRFRQAVLAAAMRGKLTEIWRAHNSFNLSLKKYYELTKGQKLKAKNISEPCEEKTWLRCNIGHIFNVKSGDGLTAKEMNDSGDIPVYGGNGITGYHDKYNTEEPTIVIGRVGYYCGSVHLTPEKSWITDNALLVDFNSELITKQFAHWLLKATNLRVDTSSSAQPVISGAKIYSIEIVIPPIEEQHEIVRRVEQLFAYADTIEKQVNSALTRVNSLTQSILAKAFRGELTAQWRAENPDLISGENSAAALLEKIKAERAASGGKKNSRKKA